MRTENGEEYLEHIVYRDSDRHLLDRSGIGPVATSLFTDDLKGWNKLLLPRVGGATNPYPSLCYLVVNEKAALLYRDRDRLSDRARRQDFAHVLIGSSRTLRADRALGMLDWRWPDGEKVKNGDYARQVSRIRVSQFISAADAGLKRLRDSAAPPENLERPLIEQVRRNPDKAFVVLTDEDSTLAVRLLIALVRQLGSGVIENGFSTYEEEYHDHLGLPRFVFSTGRLAVPRSYQFSRQVIRLRLDDVAADDLGLVPAERPATASLAGADAGIDTTTADTSADAEETDTSSTADTSNHDAGTDEDKAVGIREIIPAILRDDISPGLVQYITQFRRDDVDEYYRQIGQVIHESLIDADQQSTKQLPQDQLPAGSPFSGKDWILIAIGAACFILVALFAGVFL